MHVLKKNQLFCGFRSERERGKGVREREGEMWVRFLRENFLSLFGSVWVRLGFVEETQTNPKKLKQTHDSNDMVIPGKFHPKKL